MNDIRNTPEYNRWKNAVKRRDGSACRKCGFESNLHIHHIKPCAKYPEFAIELDNGLTLCGNCHSLLKGKEETENLHHFMGNDTKIERQLSALDALFANSLLQQLKLGNWQTRKDVFRVALKHLKVYPDSLGEFLLKSLSILPHRLYYKAGEYLVQVDRANYHPLNRVALQHLFDYEPHESYGADPTRLYISSLLELGIENKRGINIDLWVMNNKLRKMEYGSRWSPKRLMAYLMVDAQGKASNITQRLIKAETPTEAMDATMDVLLMRIEEDGSANDVYENHLLMSSLGF